MYIEYHHHPLAISLSFFVSDTQPIELGAALRPRRTLRTRFARRVHPLAHLRSVRVQAQRIRGGLTVQRSLNDGAANVTGLLVHDIGEKLGLAGVPHLVQTFLFRLMAEAEPLSQRCV